jgi:hypothetical protein
MDTTEQYKSMDAARLGQNIAAAGRIGAYPIDLWGAEWWYARFCLGDPAPIDAVLTSVTPPGGMLAAR